MDCLTANHTAEIQNILGDAAFKISKFKDLLEAKQKQVNDVAYVEKLVQNHEKEKQKAMADFSNYKALMSENEEKLAKAYLTKFNALKSRLDEVNDAFSSRVSSFEASFHESKRANEEGMSKLRSKHEAEISALQSDYSRKREQAAKEFERNKETEISELSRRNMEAINSLKTEMNDVREKQLTELRSQLSKEKEMALLSLQRDSEEKMKLQSDSMTMKLEASSKELHAKCEELNKLTAESTKIQSTLKNKVEELQRYISQQEGDVDANRHALLSDIASAKSEISTKSAVILEQKEELGRTSRLLSLNNVKVAEMEKTTESLNEELRIIKESFELSEKKNKETDLTGRQRIAQLETESLSQTQTIGILQQTITAMEVRACSANDEQQETIRALNITLAKVKDELSAALLSTAAADQRTSLLQQMADRERELSQERIRSEEILRRQFQEEKQALATSSLLQMEVHTAKELKWKENLDQIVAAHLLENQQKEGNLRALSETNEAVLTEMRVMLEGAQVEMEEYRIQAQEETLRLKDQIQSLESSLLMTENRCVSLAGELEDKRATINDLQLRLEGVGQEMLNKNSSFEVQARLLRDELDAKNKDDIRLLKEHHAMDLITVKEDSSKSHASVIEKLQNQQKVVVEDLQNRIKESLLQLEVAHQSLENERFKSQEQLANSRGSVESLQQQLMANIELEREAFVKELSSRLMEQEERLTALSRQRESDLTESFSSKLKALEAKTAEALDRARIDHEFEMKRVVKVHDEESKTAFQNVAKSLQDERKRDLDVLQASHISVLNKLKAKHEDEIAAFTRKVNDAVNLVAQSERERADTERRLAKLYEDMQNAVSENARRVKLLEQDLSDQIAKQREKSEIALSSLRNESEREKSFLLSSHTTEVGQLKAERSQLLDQNSELEARWQRRESRPEDVQRIGKLEGELNEAGQTLLRTREEMMYFKREMINREESYNTKFNVSPVVGVMNVVNRGGKQLPGSKNATSRTSRPQKPIVLDPVEHPGLPRRSSLTSLPGGNLPSLNGLGGITSNADASTNPTTYRTRSYNS